MIFLGSIGGGWQFNAYLRDLGGVFFRKSVDRIQSEF